MVLGFKRRFEPMVKDGSKRHTIRAGERWRPGMICDCFVDTRQRTMRLLGRWMCSRVEQIRIQAKFRIDTEHIMLIPDQLRIWVAGQELTHSEICALCYADGFRNCAVSRAWYEFAEFWLAEHGRKVKHDPEMTLRFAGQLIHWDYDNPGRVVTKRKARKAPVA